MGTDSFSEFCIKYRWALTILGIFTIPLGIGVVLVILGIIGFVKNSNGESARTASPAPAKIKTKSNEPKDLQKYRDYFHKQVDKDDVVDDIMGNGGYLAVTKDAVYIVNIGVTSGQFFGKKVKSFAIDEITSVEVGEKMMTVYLEIATPGTPGSQHKHTGYSDAAENRVFFPKQSMSRVAEIAKTIRKLKNSK